MTYNKKQMQPLIAKYGINPESNALFLKICEMFNDKPNYQIWAVKMVFSQKINMQSLKTIHKWISENEQLINKLSKGNIVSYTTKTDIVNLFNEMDGLEQIAFIKNIISHFNTEQKKLLTANILKKEYTPLEASQSTDIKYWYNTLKAFNQKPMHIKNRFYSTCSAFRNFEDIKNAIENCLKASYEWKEGKEDLFAFMEHNTKDCDVVFEKGNCVVVRVPSFTSSKKLCGGGRTQWCISRESQYFSSYVTNYNNRTQYFLFDFDRKETDAFAHIGFTIESGKGIVEAQTGNNNPMIKQYRQGDENLSIYDIFDKFGISINMLIKLPKDLGFKWDIYYMTSMADKDPNHFKVVYNKQNRLIIEIKKKSALSLVSKTFIDISKFSYTGNNNAKTFVFMDFNLDINDDKSLIIMGYNKDAYETLSLSNICSIFGNDLTNAEYLSTLGISRKDYLPQDNINPSILLHKYINEGDEAAAISLINNERGNIDINYEFNCCVPVYSAIHNNMLELFKVIINEESFDCSTKDGFGETLLESILYLYSANEVEIISKEETETLAKMINIILESKNFDLNVKDLNNDTPLNVACEFINATWVVEAIAKRPNIDVNARNDYGCGAIMNCLYNKNFEALKIIGQRPDLQVTEADIEEAKKLNIDLKQYIHPSESFFEANETELEYELTAALHS